MRRPLCCVCMAFVVAVFIFLTFSPYSEKQNIFTDSKLMECQGTVYYKECNKGKYTLFVKTADDRVLVALDHESRIPKLGSIVYISGNMEGFSTARNPGSFDKEQYYRLQGINYMIKDAKVIMQSKDYSCYKEYLYQLRNTITQIYDNAVTKSKVIDNKDAAVIKAMVLGDKTTLDGDDKRLFQRSGMAHILAISGLHISILGMGIYKLLSKIRVPNLISCLFAVVIMFLYGEMVGMPGSAYRAIFMFGLRMLALVCKRSYDMLTALALSAMTLLMEQPLYVFHTGFLLSFGAILGIGGLFDMIKADTTQFSFSKKTNTWFSIQVKRHLLRIQETLCTSLSIFLIHFPIMLMNYYEFPIYSFGLNLIIIPTVGLLMVVGLLGIFWAGVLSMLGDNVGCIVTDVSGFICHHIIAFYENLCDFSLKLPGANWIVGRPGNWKIIVFYLVVLFLYALHRVNVERHDSKLCLPFQIKMICIFVTVAFLTRESYGELKVTFMDVGQGDGIWIENDNGHHYLIDSGSTSNSKLGIYTLIPFLKYTGTSKIDAVFLTHLDTDHISGIMELISTDSGIEVKRVILAKTIFQDEKYEELISECKKHGISISFVKAGDVICDGDLKLNILHPSILYESDSKNAHSLAIQLDYNGFHGLLAGDIEADGEKILADELVQDGSWDCHLYKASHHGSRNSNTEELLNVLKPRLTVISSGRNSYGHPHKETLERLSMVGSRIIRTDQNGAVMIRVHDGDIRVDTFIDK